MYKNSVNKKSVNKNSVKEIIMENTVHVAEIIINPDHFLCPMKPIEDTNGKYIWKSIHTNNIDFVKFQEEGFIITTDLIHGYTWLRKPKNNN